MNRFRVFADDPRYAKTIIRKLLTIEMLEKTVKIAPSIMDCIEKSLLYSEESIGIAALGPECYTNLSPIFEPIVEDYHCVAADVKQPNSQWGDSKEFEMLADDSVQSIRMSCRRSIGEQPFVISMNENQLAEVLAMVRIGFQIEKNVSVSSRFNHIFPYLGSTCSANSFQ